MLRTRNFRPLGQVAIELGLLTSANLDIALSVQAAVNGLGVKKRLGEILVERRMLTPTQLAQALEYQRRHYQQRQIGGYHLHEKLGEGGMGAVYRATRLADGVEVAIKVLSKRVAGDAQVLDRFLREAAIAVEIRHPHVVRTYGAVQIAERPLLVMDYVRGEGLDRLLTRGPLQEADALKLMRQLASALGYLAERGVVHRDVKPGNVIVAPGHHAWLIDLGLAKRVGVETTIAPALTQTGHILGTPDFMAPEQILGQPVDARCDIYSLGATFYTMVTGQTPYAGSANQTMLLTAHLVGAFRDPLELAPGLSEGSVHLIEKAMAVDPNDRYPSMAALILDIDAVASGAAPTTERLAPDRSMVRRALGKRASLRRSHGRATRRRVSSRLTWAHLLLGVLSVALVAVAARQIGSGPRERTYQESVSQVDSGKHPSSAPTAISSQVSSSFSVNATPQYSRYGDKVWGFSFELPGAWSEIPGGPFDRSWIGPNSARVEVAVAPCGRDVGYLPLAPMASMEHWYRSGATLALDQLQGDANHVSWYIDPPNQTWLSVLRTGISFYRIEVTGLEPKIAQHVIESFKASAEVETQYSDQAGRAACCSVDLRTVRSHRWLAYESDRGKLVLKTKAPQDSSVIILQIIPSQSNSVLDPRRATEITIGNWSGTVSYTHKDGVARAIFISRPQDPQCLVAGANFSQHASFAERIDFWSLVARCQVRALAQQDRLYHLLGLPWEQPRTRAAVWNGARRQNYTELAQPIRGQLQKIIVVGTWVDPTDSRKIQRVETAGFELIEGGRLRLNNYVRFGPNSVQELALDATNSEVMLRSSSIKSLGHVVLDGVLVRDWVAGYSCMLPGLPLEIGASRELRVFDVATERIAMVKLRLVQLQPQIRFELDLNGAPLAAITLDPQQPGAPRLELVSEALILETLPQ
jgi:serine/threonine-protein kinase